MTTTETEKTFADVPGMIEEINAGLKAGEISANEALERYKEALAITDAALEADGNNTDMLGQKARLHFNIGVCINGIAMTAYDMNVFGSIGCTADARLKAAASGTAQKADLLTSAKSQIETARNVYTRLGDDDGAAVCSRAIGTIEAQIGRAGGGIFTGR